MHLLVRVVVVQCTGWCLLHVMIGVARQLLCEVSLKMLLGMQNAVAHDKNLSCTSALVVSISERDMLTALVTCCWSLA